MKEQFKVLVWYESVCILFCIGLGLSMKLLYGSEMLLKEYFELVMPFSVGFGLFVWISTIIIPDFLDKW